MNELMVDKAQALVLLAEERAQYWVRWEDIDDEILAKRQEQDRVMRKMKELDSKRESILKSMEEDARLSIRNKRS